MKTGQFVLFISIALSVYSLANYYVFLRGWQALQGTQARALYAVACILLFASFIAGRFLERAHAGLLTDVLIWTGSFWFGCLLYFLLIAAALDLARLINLFAPFLPSPLPSTWKIRVFAGAIALVAVLMAYGYAAACRLTVRRVDITVPARSSALREIKIAAISDIHLGTIVGRRRFSRMVDKINGLNPDLLLMAGDILDEDPQSAIRNNLGDLIRQVRAPLGIYACTGNHEFIGNIKATSKYISDHNITLLRDTAVKLDCGVVVAGRDDFSKDRFSGERCRPLREILAGMDSSLPLIVLDHQPSRFNEAVEAGTDLLICGHTHAGQFWPINLVVKALFELSYGYKVKGNTHIVVSSGAGTWGPPVRIAARPEVLDIRLRLTPSGR